MKPPGERNQSPGKRNANLSGLSLNYTNSAVSGQQLQSMNQSAIGYSGRPMIQQQNPYQNGDANLGIPNRISDLSHGSQQPVPMLESSYNQKIGVSNPNQNKPINYLLDNRKPVG